MTRIRFKGFSLNRLSQTGPLAKTGHPSDMVEKTAGRPACQATRYAAFAGVSCAKWADSPKPSLSGWRTSLA
jgi:hypothetical protein